MIDIDALKAAGLTNKRLEAIFTTEPPESLRKKVAEQTRDARRGRNARDGDDIGARARIASTVSTMTKLEKLPDKPTDWDVRCHLETIIRAEILEGQMRCAKDFSRHAAADLAYASVPIHPLINDLMKVAMGHLKLEDVERSSANLSTQSKEAFFERDARGKAVAVNRPKLIEVSHNLVHSLVTRRVAAIATEVYQTFPLMKFDTYSNNMTSRLTGDVVTQLAEQMAGSFGYRHDYEESIRHASLYTHGFKFKERAWTEEKQTLPLPQPKGGAAKSGREQKKEFKRRTVKEGVKFVLPHPSRVYWDISQPLSKLNNDCGPQWIGHWEVVTIGSILDDPGYFNTAVMNLDVDLYTWFQDYASYFSQYYGGCTNIDNAERINPTCNRGCINAAALALANDRTANIGLWAQSHRGASTVLTQHYKRIIPKQYGIGSYEDPVWIRFVMAGNTTVVSSEICGSPPVSVNSYNAADSLLANPSFAIQALQWQQDITNDMNELMHVSAQGLIRIWLLNKNGLKPEEITTIENAIKHPDFRNLKDIVLKYDLRQLQARGEDPRTQTEKLHQVRVETATKTKEIFDRIVQKIAMAERLMFFSPQELGQVSPRTVTATEMKSVRETTLGIRDFHLVGVKSQIDADKRIIHHSYMAFGSDELEVPVAERYDPKVIEKAGFEIVDDGTGAPPDGLYTIRGKKLGLLYDYVYTTRNTDDTPPEAARAQGLSQVYEILTKDPVLSENLTLEQRMELANSIFTILSPDVFKLRVPEGKDPKSTVGGAVDALKQQVEGMIPQISQALQALAQKQTEFEGKIASFEASQHAISTAVSKLSTVLERLAPPDNGLPTPKGSVGPGYGTGAGARPLRGVRRARPVPAL